MNIVWTFGSFLFFTALVAVLTWRITHREDVKSESVNTSSKSGLFHDTDIAFFSS